MLLFHKFCKITLLLLSTWRKKRVKPEGVCSWTNTIRHPTFPYRPPNLLFTKWAKKKNPRPHLLTFGHYYFHIINTSNNRARLGVQGRSQPFCMEGFLMYICLFTMGSGGILPRKSFEFWVFRNGVSLILSTNFQYLQRLLNVVSISKGIANIASWRDGP